jgi:hypothetical protein
MFSGVFLTRGVPPQDLDIMGFPGAVRLILHCTLLLKAAGQEKFALRCRLPGRGP